jgi:formate hydrogenlyase subunit 3/multisubunit Na+/H+ antiporter MnhD subunit
VHLNKTWLILELQDANVLRTLTLNLVLFTHMNVCLFVLYVWEYAYGKLPAGFQKVFSADSVSLLFIQNFR